MDRLDSGKQLKIVGYMAALYHEMANTATPATELLNQEAQETYDDKPVLVWQGRLIQTCISVGIPEGYYKKVVDGLRTLGCIEMISRGRRGTTLTVIALHFPPTPELYQAHAEEIGLRALTPGPTSDKLAADVREIQHRLGGLSIVEAFKNHEDRVKALETAVEGLQQQVSQLQTSTTSSNTNK